MKILFLTLSIVLSINTYAQKQVIIEVDKWLLKEANGNPKCYIVYGSDTINFIHLSEDNYLLPDTSKLSNVKLGEVFLETKKRVYWQETDWINRLYHISFQSKKSKMCKYITRVLFMKIIYPKPALVLTLGSEPPWSRVLCLNSIDK